MRENDKLRSVRVRVGKAVRQLRRQRGWTQEQLAERVGNNFRHLGQVERGEVNVTIDILSTIAASLSVDISELFRSDSPDHIAITQQDVNQLTQIVERLKRGERGSN